MRRQKERHRSPSEQEIADNLAGLNRHCKCRWSPTKESELAWQKGFANYIKWFKSHDIAIYEDEKKQVWKLGHASDGDSM